MVCVLPIRQLLTRWRGLIEPRRIWRITPGSLTMTNGLALLFVFAHDGQMLRWVGYAILIWLFVWLGGHIEKWLCPKDQDEE